MRLREAKLFLFAESGTTVTIPVIHKTTVESARSIIKVGFSLRHVGRTKKKTGWPGAEPKGVYLTRWNEGDPPGRPEHMWQPGAKGTYVFATVRLKNPLTGDDVKYKDLLRDEHGSDGSKLTSKLKKLGYDGMIGPLGEVVAFDPASITVDVDRTERILARHVFDTVEPTSLSSGHGGEKPSREKISAQIRKMIDDMGGDPRSINSGECDIFAQELVDSLGYGSAEEIVVEDDDGNIPNHAWAEIDGRYYDAESPGGVDDWRELPIFIRWAARRLDESVQSSSLVSFFEAAEAHTAMSKDEMGDWIESKKLRDGFGRLDMNDVSHMSGYGDYWILEDVPVSKIEGDSSFPPRKNRRKTPIILGFDGENYEVLDGRHRVSEARHLGDRTIKAWVGYQVEDRILLDAIWAMQVLNANTPETWASNQDTMIDFVRSMRAGIIKLRGIFGSRPDEILARYSVVPESLMIEMASRRWNDSFSPGWRLFVKADMEKDPSERLTKYVLGVRKGGQEKDEDPKLYKVNNDGKPYWSPVKLKDGMTIDSALKLLADNGFKDVTDHGPLKSGKAKYFKGERRSGVVKPFRGTLYHGTPDIHFFSETYNSSGFGDGSHLKSLNGGDAFSLTPSFEVASDFANDGMVIEFKASLKVYYAGQGEDDLDEIDPPDSADSVAIPVGRYDEKEIALLHWDDNLSAVAVHLMIGNDWRRYPTSANTAEYRGEWSAYVADWCSDMFGKDFEKIVEEYSGADSPDDYELEDGTLTWPKMSVLWRSTKPYFEHEDHKGHFYDTTSFLEAVNNEMAITTEGYEFVDSSDPSSTLVGDKIKSAAAFVYATKKVYAGTHHGDAVSKAIEAGEDIWSDLGNEEVDPAKIHVDLFVTEKNRLLDRWGALQHFDVSGSEYIHKQKAITQE